jgi:bifunctional isochorismate lyase/aryl carrier protein
MALQYVATRCGAVISLEQVLRSGADDVTTFDGLRARLAAWTGVAAAEFDAEENLMDYGLDSIRVMSLVGEWKAAGIAVAFEELARRPSLNGWWALLQQRRDAAAQRQAA